MKTRAIVVGAGAAGISAAFGLQQAGCEVRILEGSAEVGGRTQSVSRNGFIMDIAAGLLPSSYWAVLQLMSDAGLTALLEPMTSATAVFRDGRLHYIEATNMAGCCQLLRLRMALPSGHAMLRRRLFRAGLAMPTFCALVSNRIFPAREGRVAIERSKPRQLIGVFVHQGDVRGIYSICNRVRVQFERQRRHRA